MNKLFRQAAVITDTAFARSIVDAKQAALLFDQLIIIKTSAFRIDRAFKLGSPEAILGHELDWLQNNSIVRFEKENALRGEAFFQSSPALVQLHKEIQVGYFNVALLPQAKADMYFRRLANATARAAAVFLDQCSDVRHVPLVFHSDGSIDHLSAKTTPQMTSAMSAVFNFVPIPESDTPWENILDLRNDPNTRSAFMDLREWLRSAIDENTTVADLKEQLEHRLDSYEQSLKRHKTRYNYLRLEATALGVFSLPENLLKLRLADIGKGLLSLRKLEIDRLEDEAKLDGCEARYLVHLGEQFSVKT